MKKILIIVGFIILLTLFIPIILSKSNASTDEQIQIGDLYYKIISEENKTVEVTGPERQWLSSVSIPKVIKIKEKNYTVTSIGDNAFYGYNSLKAINIPNSVTRIGVYAFYECHGLTNITIPSTVTVLEECSFAGCSNLTNVVILNGVKSIGNSAFSGTNLKSITIPNSVTNIGEYAFAYSGNLINIVLSNKLTNIGEWAFSRY